MAENISAKIIDIEIIRGNDISFFFLTIFKYHHSMLCFF